MNKKGMPKPKTEMTIGVNSVISLSKFKVPEKIEFISPLKVSSVSQSFGEINKFPELANYNTEEKWQDKLKTGKLISINDKEIGGLHNVADGYTDIRQCVGWKLVRIENQLISKSIHTPILAKTKTGEIFFVDGRTTACLLNEFKRDIMVWLLDLTKDGQDFIEQKLDESPDMQPVFDYGNIKPEHQALIRDVLKIAPKDSHDFKSKLSVLFKLENEDNYDLDDSIFIQYAKEAGLVTSKQGHITEKKGSNKPMNWPIISICDDVRKFDKLVEIIMQKVMLKVREAGLNEPKK